MPAEDLAPRQSRFFFLAKRAPVGQTAFLGDGNFFGGCPPVTGLAEEAQERIVGALDIRAIV